MAAIEGLDKLLAKLSKIASNEAIMKGIEKACIRVESTAKEDCPVNDGQLRASITHDLDSDKLQGIVGTNVEYAAYVEFGTGIYAAKGDGRTTPWSYEDATGKFVTTVGQKPHPFMYPAMAKNTEKIKEDIIKSIKDELGRLS